MNRVSTALIATLLPTIIHAQQPLGPSRGHLTSGTYAFVNANVISMAAEGVTRNATVLVRDGRIAEVGTSVRLPANTRTIDARGKYLVPGLADMHTHLYSDGEAHDSIAPLELGVMLANGVTVARFMAGTAEQIKLRERVRRGEIVGPQLWLASPMFSTRADANVRVIASPDDARAAVREAATAGYDFIKVTFGITGATYDAVVDEAKTRRIPVAGHVEPALGLKRAMAAGQQLEHLDSFFEESLADSAPSKESLTQFGAYRQQNWASVDFMDDRKMTALAESVVRSGAWVGPTLEAFNRWFSVPYTDDEMRALPDWNLIPEPMRTAYMNARARYWAQPVPKERRARFAELRTKMVKKIADAGGASRLLAGSDTPDLLMVYGFTLHRELEAFVNAGLTPYQALATATRNPAEYFGALNEWGTIQPGRRADMMLLTANPLEDIRNTRRIESVVVGGRILEKAQLDAMIAAAARTIRP